MLNLSEKAIKSIMFDINHNNQLNFDFNKAKQKFIKDANKLNMNLDLDAAWSKIKADSLGYLKLKALSSNHEKKEYLSEIIKSQTYLYFIKNSELNICDINLKLHPKRTGTKQNKEVELINEMIKFINQFIEYEINEYDMRLGEKLFLKLTKRNALLQEYNGKTDYWSINNICHFPNLLNSLYQLVKENRVIKKLDMKDIKCKLKRKIIKGELKEIILIDIKYNLEIKIPVKFFLKTLNTISPNKSHIKVDI